MGFTKEMVRRWERALPPQKSAIAAQSREGDPRKEFGGRHSIMLSICWDDWEQKKEDVRRRMERRS